MSAVYYDVMGRRKPGLRSFMHQHRLAFWLTVDFIGLVGLYMLAKYIWVLSTPLVKLMGGQ